MFNEIFMHILFYDIDQFLPEVLVQKYISARVSAY